MEIKFNSIEEIEKFVTERLGYVKADADGKPEEKPYKPVIIKECPYGLVNCPYNKNIPPYNPILTPITYSDTSSSVGTDNNSVTVKIKDVKNNN